MGYIITLDDLPSDELSDEMVCKGLVPDTDDNWRDLMTEYDIDEDEVSLTLVRRLLNESIRRSQELIDFDDMLYLPVVFGSSFDQYDVVFVDELQDLSGIQHEMVSRMLSATSRFIGVGDQNQAIYRFRGAAADSMTIAQERFRCVSLPLSISYRCPKSVVQKAQTWVKTIEASEQAQVGMVVEYPEHSQTCPKGGDAHAAGRGSFPAQVGQAGGDVSNTPPVCTCGGLQGGWLIKDFKPTDVLLCRLTRPLVETAFKLIRGRVPCRVLGRDIGQGLVGLVNKSKLPTDAQVSRFDDWLSAYERRESDKLRAKEEFAKLGLLQDKIATIRVFMDDLEDTKGETNEQRHIDATGNALLRDSHIVQHSIEASVGQLIQEIESLFKDDGGFGKVTLATGHKSKGLEWPRVFILDAHLYQPISWSKDQVGEVNIQYVMATRAMEELYYIKTEAIR